MATVTVTPPCTCAAARWFLCADACPSWQVIAEYDCAGFDEIDSAPEPSHVALIQRAHPGCSLRYVSVGVEHERAICDAMAGLRTQSPLVADAPAQVPAAHAA